MGWLGTFAKRIELTIDNTNIDSDLTNFPVLINLTSSQSFVFTEIGSDANRKKIAVTTSDGTTQCYVEIERWDNSGQKAWLHGRIPVVASGSATTVYLYYDSSQADNSAYVGDVGDAANVWDSDFSAVFHMGQDPTGGADCILDSTSNANHGTPSGAMTSGDLVDGKVGKGLDFDASDDNIRISDNNSLDVGSNDMTAEAVVYVNPGSSNREIFSHGDFGSSDLAYVMRIEDLNNAFEVFLSDNGTAGSGHRKAYRGTADLSSGWHYVAFTWGSDVLVLSVDESEITPTKDFDDAINSLKVPSSDAFIGALNNSGLINFFDGVIDEIRISNGIARSVSWRKATYYSLWDGLITWGNEEVLFLEDASLNLSAYYQELENFKAFLRAHDGVELRDLSSALAAYNLSEEDISAWLAAYYEDKSNLSSNLETWATHYGDLGSALDVKAQKLESLMVRFEAAKANFKDLASFLAATDGSVFKDLAAFLSVTDGVTLKNCGLNLKVIQGVPAFRSITAQRVSSVVHEVS